MDGFNNLYELSLMSGFTTGKVLPLRFFQKHFPVHKP